MCRYMLFCRRWIRVFVSSDDFALFFFKVCDTFSYNATEVPPCNNIHCRLIRHAFTFKRPGLHQFLPSLLPQRYVAPFGLNLIATMPYAGGDHSISTGAKQRRCRLFLIPVFLFKKNSRQPRMTSRFSLKGWGREFKNC